MADDQINSKPLKAQEGEWVLLGPRGQCFKGDNPLMCVKAEINSRVPASVQLQRLFDSLDDDKEYREVK
jgi:hypothetical protein